MMIIVSATMVIAASRGLEVRVALGKLVIRRFLPRFEWGER